MNKLAALMSSDKDSWCTPEVVLERVRLVAPIALDPCGQRGSLVRAATELRRARCDDGLRFDWMSVGGLVYVNPPYGREIHHWVMRCHVVGQLGGECIALLPARTDTSWWHRFVAPPAADAVCLWRGRLTFLGAPASAPFPSAVAYYGPRKHRFADAFENAGAIWT